MKGKKQTKKQRRRARIIRRRIGVAAGLLALVALALTLKHMPAIAGWFWAGATLGLGAEAALMTRRKAPQRSTMILLGVACAAMIAGGVLGRGYVLSDQGVLPAQALVETLKVTDRWPDDIDRYTGLKTLDMRGSTISDFAPLQVMRGLQLLDARGDYAFDRDAYETAIRALPGCRICWSIPIGDRYIDSEAEDVDLTGLGLTAEEINALQIEYPDKSFSYTVTLMGKEIDTSAEALDLQGAGDIDPDALAAALSLLPEVREVDLRGAPLSAQTAQTLCGSFPEIHFMFTCDVPDAPMTSEDETVTLTGGDFGTVRAYMAFVDYMPNLKYIDARAIPMDGEEIQALQADPRGAKIAYGFSVYGVNASTLDTQITLDGIRLQGPEQVEQLLRAMPNLQRISLCDCGLSQADMAALFDAHPEVKFVWVVDFGNYHLRTDATAFTTNLYANNKFHYTSETFAPLRFCTDLLMLDLGHCDITTIEGLSGLKKLRVLILADNEITDISPLEGMADLEYVELFLNKITDFTPLANKAKLVDLNIYYNPISDVTPLTTCTALRRLWIGECGLSESKLGQLREALPDCKINAKGSSSTGRGWREHSHYNTLKEMYRTGTYLPFD